MTVGQKPSSMNARGENYPSKENGRYSDLSVIILAGGKSQRMGSDKAFFKLKDRPFIRIIADEMLKISSDVVVAIGKKDPSNFELVLDKKVRIINDSCYVLNPIGGMVSALAKTRHRYAAVLACDSPLVKSRLVGFLYQMALNHDAAVPTWDDDNRIEPLCAVYKVKEAERAANAAMQDGKLGPKHMVSYLTDVNYIRMSTLRSYDTQLGSFINVNTAADYEALQAGQALQSSKRLQGDSAHVNDSTRASPPYITSAS